MSLQSKGKRETRRIQPPLQSPPCLNNFCSFFGNCFKCRLLYEPCHFQVRELCPSPPYPRSLGTVTAWLLCLLPSVDRDF